MRAAGLLAITLAVFVCGVCVSSTPLVGGSKCTWGPSYWCDNLSNAKDCRATRHCIQTVWEKRVVPVDDDSICKICKDMVTQARDQLRSNETEEEMKEVFEGSCKLIPIKLVQKECITLADNFIPELIEALSSQMNPDQVCSVAGLCNSARIDELMRSAYQAAMTGTLKEEEVDMHSDVAKDNDKKPTTALTQLSCGNCNLLSNKLQQKFEATDRDDMVEELLHACGSMSSFSDACANLVLTYFNDMYDHVQQHLKSNGLCHISGVCASRYHQHEDDVKEPEALTTLDGVSDDIPCELCEQLVKHLRDVLVANTTETEFKQVLEGFCKQSRGFKDECLSIVDQYYVIIYKTLVSNLDSKGACTMMGVCPRGQAQKDVPIMPLLPVVAPAEVEVTIKKLGANEPKFSQDQIMNMQIPIDHLMGAANPSQLVQSGELCTLCEYMLHFIQETLATPATDDEIKHAVENICTHLPHGVAGQCHNFVEMYGDAVIALLIQGLNPRSVCPMMQMCPHNIEKQEDIEVFHPVTLDSDKEQDKPTCPLCLFAVEQAQTAIRDNKSKDNIKKVLDGLCSHLPTKLRVECVDFVDTYSNELIDMLITDFKPQEICVQLKLCPKSNDVYDELGIGMSDSDESASSEENENNEIDSTSDDMRLPIDIKFGTDFGSSPNCLLCEEVVKTVEKKIGKHATKADIKDALEHTCDKLKKPVANKCHKLMDKFGDQIADLLLKEMDPKLICAELGMCLFSEQEDLEIDEALKYDVIVMPKGAITKLAKLESPKVVEPPTCVLCEFVMTKLEADLKNKTEQDEIKKALENICKHMPATIHKQCDAFVDGYAAAIIKLLSDVPPKEICQKLQLCFSQVISDEVVECGVCHGVSQSLLPFLRSTADHASVSTQDMISKACEDLPAKYYSICSEMISIYGISIMRLSERSYMDQSHVCAEIGKCFDNEKSALAFARITA